MIDDVDPIKIDPTSMSDTYKVFDNLHMQWMYIWMQFVRGQRHPLSTASAEIVIFGGFCVVEIYSFIIDGCVDCVGEFAGAEE